MHHPLPGGRAQFKLFVRSLLPGGHASLEGEMGKYGCSQISSPGVGRSHCMPNCRLLESPVSHSDPSLIQVGGSGGNTDLHDFMFCPLLHVPAPSLLRNQSVTLLLYIAGLWHRKSSLWCNAHLVCFSRWDWRLLCSVLCRDPAWQQLPHLSTVCSLCNNKLSLLPGS